MCSSDLGYAVTGLIDPARVYTNASAQPGDVLILTKPIGTGVITTALKQGKADPAWIDTAIRSMTTLNSAASAAAIASPGVHAITDITGFGLMGHGREMALGSRVVLEIEVASVPLIPGALDAVRLGAIPAGLIANREFAECLVADASASTIPDDVRTLLYDPQTAGGLLISVAPDNAPALVSSLRERGVPAEAIGRVRAAAANADVGPAIVLR